MIGTPQTTEKASRIIVFKQIPDESYEFWVEQHIPGRIPSPLARYIDAEQYGIRTIEGAATLAIQLAHEEAQS